MDIADVYGKQPAGCVAEDLDPDAAEADRQHQTPARTHCRTSHDLATGTVLRHDFGAGSYANEAVFVPRQGGMAEDDGWLMSVVYNAAEDRSNLVVLNADDITGDPVATVALPARVPAGFHGCWVPSMSNEQQVGL